MAFIKFKRGAGKWETLYVEAIRNRLRRDKNLTDLIDIAAARETLGLTGDNNKTHNHDDRYLPKIEAIKILSATRLQHRSSLLTDEVRQMLSRSRMAARRR